jgi:hypothetical protein
MEFSEDLIKKYLDLKAYEKRGMTREQYIQLERREGVRSCFLHFKN